MKISILLFAILSIHSCENSTKDHDVLPKQKQVNTGMQEINRKFLLEEAAEISAYIERRGWQMQKTGTGLWYMIYQEGDGGKVENGMVATVEYVVTLLNGTEVYNSKELGSKSFTIGQDNVETGLHEGLLLMHLGDRAKFVLPSHLAHGLTGDNSKIPPRSSVVYDIELVALK